MYRTEALEDALKKVKDLEQRKEYLEAINSNQEAQIVNFKIELEEKDKIIIKSKSKYIEEINELKRQQMQTTENLRSTVLEREVLRENDRILLNTFDMMKKYIDQMKEQYSKSNTVGADTHQKCQNCDHIAKSITDLQMHIETTHNGKRFDYKKCDSKLESETELLKHVETKHSEKENHGKSGSEKCETSEDVSRNTDDLIRHVSKEHSRDELFECDKCQFDSIIKVNFESHMKTQHEQNNSAYCIFWNQGYCQYGIECRFAHQEIPACKFQEKCEHYRCPYFHYDKSWNNFLGKGLRIQSLHK